LPNKYVPYAITNAFARNNTRNIGTLFGSAMPVYTAPPNVTNAQQAFNVSPESSHPACSLLRLVI
jgi:hypothetical protein